MVNNKSGKLSLAAGVVAAAAQCAR